MTGSQTAAIVSRDVLKAILSAWLLAGTLDITAAVIYYPLASGVKVITLLQGIASGLLGAKAFAGGLRTAVLGLACHYLIALTWTLVFFLAVRTFNVLSRNLFLTGMVYGVVVWLVMNLIVLPLSNVRHVPFDLGRAIVGTIILMFCIGLPIAMIVGRHYE
jgi:hypothetical protein